MRISDWSSDVCSSDLYLERGQARPLAGKIARDAIADPDPGDHQRREPDEREELPHALDEAPRPRRAVAPVVDVPAGIDRKSVVSGKSVSVRVELGGRRIITKKNTQQ